MRVRLLTAQIFAQIFATSCVLAVLTGCTYRNLKGSPPQQHPVIRGTQGAPSFEQVREQVFAPRCTSCHSGHHSSQFLTYEDTYSRRGEIRSWVYELREMPEGAPLTTEQSAMLLRWLDAGAPREAITPDEPVKEPTPEPSISGSALPSPTPTAPLEALTPTWENVSKNFFKPHCARCHTGSSGAAKMLNVDSIEQIREQAARIHELVITLPDGDPDVMPPRGLRARIKDTELFLFVRWLQLGMPGPVAEPTPTPAPAVNSAPAPTTSPSAPATGASPSPATNTAYK